MALILAMSSWVAAGHVGLSAMVPIWQRLGREALQLPTTRLSNHKAWSAVSGGATDPEELEAMLGAFEVNGWLEEVDTMSTGYLPTAAHVAWAGGVESRLRVRNPMLRVVCDPVLGDDPKGLYLPETTAEAVRDQLAPLADVLTPNRFELAWLTGLEVNDLQGAVAAARALERPVVIVTSPPLGPEETGLLEVTPDAARLYRAPRRDNVPHGVGDALAALIAAGVTPGAALARLNAVIDASLGAPHLAVGALPETAHAIPPELV